MGGVPGGANYTFTATEGKLVEFRYTLATHVLEIIVTDPPLAGTGESRAHWLGEGTLVVPKTFGGAGDPTGLTYTLEHSPEATLAVADGEVVGGDEPIELESDPAGLTDEQEAKFPHLADYAVLRPVGLERDEVAVTAHRAAPGRTAPRRRAHRRSPACSCPACSTTSTPTRSRRRRSARP